MITAGALVLPLNTGESTLTLHTPQPTWGQATQFKLAGVDPAAEDE
jgi:hypothetical protein